MPALANTGAGVTEEAPVVYSSVPVPAASMAGSTARVAVIAPAASADAPRRVAMLIYPGVIPLDVAGPLVRLTEARMLELGPELIETAHEIARASGASGLFKRRA